MITVYKLNMVSALMVLTEAVRFSKFCQKCNDPVVTDALELCTPVSPTTGCTAKLD
jgi:hypothetical protein